MHAVEDADGRRDGSALRLKIGGPLDYLHLGAKACREAGSGGRKKRGIGRSSEFGVRGPRSWRRMPERITLRGPCQFLRSRAR
jgi:hypothetical protein